MHFSIVKSKSVTIWWFVFGWKFKIKKWAFYYIKRLNKYTLGTLPSLSAFLGRLKSSSLVICLWPNELIVGGTVVEDDGDDAKAGGNNGLHDECELAEVFVDVNGTPDVEYKSWLNWNRILI